MNPEKIKLAVHTADKVVDVADRAVDVIGKGIKVAKPLDAALNAEALLIEETGKRIANTIKSDSEKAQDKLEFINQASLTVREIAPKVADAIEDVLVMAIRKMPELADAAFQHIIGFGFRVSFRGSCIQHLSMWDVFYSSYPFGYLISINGL